LIELFLLAEGMVVVISQNGDRMGLIGCVAPILHSMILSSIHGPDIVLRSLPTNTDHIDPKWLLVCTVKVNCYLLLIMKQFVYIY
jgi:hypothetical protein